MVTSLYNNAIPGWFLLCFSASVLILLLCIFNSLNQLTNREIVNEMIDEKVDKYTHLSSPPCSETNIEQIQSVRQLLQEKNGKLFESYESWLTNEQILRFLIARNFDAGEKIILIWKLQNILFICEL